MPAKRTRAGRSWFACNSRVHAASQAVGAKLRAGSPGDVPAGGCLPREHEPDARGSRCVPTTAIPLLRPEGPFVGGPLNYFRPSQRLARLIALASARWRLVSWRSSLTVSRVAAPSWCRAAVIRLHLQCCTQVSSKSSTSMTITMPHKQSVSLSSGSMRRTDVAFGNITCCHTA